MSKLSFFFKFAVVFALIMGSAGIVVAMMEIESPSGINIGVLFAVAFWCFYTYSKKNGGVINADEKWSLIFIALFADTVVSFLLTLPKFMLNDIPLSYAIGGLAIMLPIHLVMLVFVESTVRKSLIKEAEKGEQS